MLLRGYARRSRYLQQQLRGLYPSRRAAFLSGPVDNSSRDGGGDQTPWPGCDAFDDIPSPLSSCPYPCVAGFIVEWPGVLERRDIIDEFRSPKFRDGEASGKGCAIRHRRRSARGLLRAL